MIERQKQRKDSQIYRQTDGHTRQTDRQTDREIERQAELFRIQCDHVKCSISIDSFSIDTMSSTEHHLLLPLSTTATNTASAALIIILLFG